MSAIRDPATITKTGRQMVTAGGDITYTKAVLYGQDISHLTKEQVEGLTSIGDPLVTVPIGISDKNDDGNGTTVVLEATFQNSNLKADLPYKAVGFFAKKDDGDEKLVLVGVATDGAYLAATSPDGVSTDSLDIKIAVAVGDASNVTAVVDPAGSVTPATLNGAISKATHDLTDKINTKADKTDLGSQIGIVTKSVSDLSDTVKANKDDTDKALATKADKADLDPLATKADVASDVKTLNDAIDTKASQADLDKTNATVATKASTTDVNSQLATKADAKDVTDALALKDDTVDVDKKISNVTNSVNSLSSTVTSNKSATDTALGTKANANDVANSFEEVRNRVKKLEGQQELTAPDFNTLTSTGIYMIENPTNGQNSPSNGNWGTLVVSRGTTGSDSRILQEYYPDSGDLPYFRMSGPGGVWRDWKQLSDQSEVNSLRDAVNTKADKTALDAYAKSADVANDVKTLQDNINAKADAQTVSDAISKIDLTPFAKTADVNSALSGKADKATIDAINKALASKRDITDSYSRDELDKKFLQLSADTGGKVSADQVSKLIAGKADQDDVDKKIKAVIDLANTKANSSDVTSLINSNADKLTQAINAITYSAKERTLPSNDANEITEDGIYRVGGDPLKNGAGQQWAFLLVKKWDENTIYQMMYGGGKGIFIRNISKTGNSYPEWTRIDIDVNGLQNTLNAKANTADVNTALSKKDDITDVDAKIKTVTDLANTKADASDTYNKKAVDDAFSQRDSKITNAQNTATQASQKADDNFNKRPVINGAGGDDLFAYKSNQLRLYPGNGKNCKNLPPAGNTQWYTVEYIFETPNNDGVAIYRSPLPEIWVVGNNGGTFGTWHKLANDDDFNNLKNQINTKANSSDVYVRKDVDNAFSEVRDRIGKLEGSQTVDSPDFNNLTASGVYYITNNGTNIKNNPAIQWGVLIVSNGNGHRISQVYYPDDGNPPWYRSLNESAWRPWYQLSTRYDVVNATNAANAASNKVDTVLGNSYVRKQGMNQNGDLVEIKHTGVKQDNGGYAFDMWSDDCTASKLNDVIKNQLPSKADKSQVNTSNNLFNRMTDDSTWKTITGIDNTNNPVLTSLRDDSPTDGGNTIGGNGAGVAFGGNDTKGVLSVGWSTPHAVIAGGNGTAPVWHEEIAWKSDISNVNNQINSTNQTVSALQQTIKTLNDTLSSANATIKTLQDTITGLQTQVSNQAQDIAYIKANYIEGKRFSKANEAAADAWEKENSQRLAFITDN